MTGKKDSPAVPLNFLLGCSEGELGNFQLARLNEAANLRKELHVILDRMIDQMSQVALATWFRQTDRNTLKQAIESPDDVIAWAKKKIRDGQRSEEELIPVPSLTPEEARPTAARLRGATSCATSQRVSAASVDNLWPAIASSFVKSTLRQRMSGSGKSQESSINRLMAAHLEPSRPSQNHGRSRRRKGRTGNMFWRGSSRLKRTSTLFLRFSVGSRNGLPALWRSAARVRPYA